MNTRAQRWSKSAYDNVSAQKGIGSESKYRTVCMKMPGLIHQSGALQALAFFARDKDTRPYVDHLARAYFEDGTKGYPDLLKAAQAADLKPYMALTRDLAEISQWFRRFAQIELKEER